LQILLTHSCSKRARLLLCPAGNLLVITIFLTAQTPPTCWRRKIKPKKNLAWKDKKLKMKLLYNP
jgi:hypothetical protein